MNKYKHLVNKEKLNKLSVDFYRLAICAFIFEILILLNGSFPKSL